MDDPAFIEENNINFEGREYPELDISIIKLRYKYNDIRQSRQHGARTGLNFKTEHKWFQLMHPILSGANAELDEIPSKVKDTSFVVRAIEGGGKLVPHPTVRSGALIGHPPRKQYRADNDHL